MQLKKAEAVQRAVQAIRQQLAPVMKKQQEAAEEKRQETARLQVRAVTSNTRNLSFQGKVPGQFDVELGPISGA